jgi:hypothetical protein
VGRLVNPKGSVEFWLWCPWQYRYGTGKKEVLLPSNGEHTSHVGWLSHSYSQKKAEQMSKEP